MDVICFRAADRHGTDTSKNNVILEGCTLPSHQRRRTSLGSRRPTVAPALCHMRPSLGVRASIVSFLFYHPSEVVANVLHHPSNYCLSAQRHIRHDEPSLLYANHVCHYFYYPLATGVFLQYGVRPCTQGIDSNEHLGIFRIPYCALQPSDVIWMEVEGDVL